MASTQYLTETYYFNGSDDAISDPQGVWTSAANVFDTSTTTSGVCSGVTGSTSTNYLFSGGTNAPTSGDTIYSVRARILAGSVLPDGHSHSATIYTNGLAESLGTATKNTGGFVEYGAYVALSTPTGGWTWDKVAALETKVYTTDAGTSAPSIFRVEIEVTTGNAETFADFYVGTPSVSAPTVTTSAATSIDLTAAVGNGEVTDDGDGAISERGFVWDLEADADPTTGANEGKVVVAGTTGVFSGAMTKLEPNTLYTYRSYAINSAGTSYGAATNFTSADYKTFLISAVMYSTGGGTVSLILYNKTDSTEVTASEISTTNWYPTLVTREFAYNATNFVSSKNYELRIKSTTGATAQIHQARLFIRLQALTKATTYNRISRIGFTAMTADAAATTQRFLYTAGDYSNPVTDWEVTGTEDGGAGTSVFQMYNVTTTDSGTTGSLVGGTGIDVNSVTKTRGRVSTVTMVDTNRYLGYYDWTSGGARYHQGILAIEASGSSNSVDLASIVELLDVPRSSVLGTSYTPVVSHTPFRTTDYDGTVTYYFETIATNGHATNTYDITLIAVSKSGAETDVTTQTLTANTGSSNVRYRTGSITIPTDTVYVKVKIPSTAAAKNVVLGGARIIVKQVNANKTVLQIPMGGSNVEHNNDVANPFVTTNQTTYALLATNVDQFTIWPRDDAEFDTYYEENSPPTTALNTPADAGAVGLSPVLNFTGTDPNSDTVTYEIQIDTVNTFDSQSSYATPAYVQATTGNFTASPFTSTAFGSSVTVGNYVIAAFGGDSNATGEVLTVTDNKGNSYTRWPSYDYAIGATDWLNMDLWYAKVITGGTSFQVTGTYDDSTSNISVIAQEFSGIEGAVSPADKTAHATGTSTSPSSGNTATLAQAAQLVVGHAVHALATSAFSLGSGYTNLTQVSVTDRQHAMESKVVNATTAVAATFTIAASREWIASVATFKATNTATPLLTKLSGSDAGFSGSPDNSDPFTSAQAVDYTVQSPLGAGTYYWRVRAKDPSGTNTWGTWSSTRSFVASGGATYTRTHTTDALRRTANTRTHTTDSLKRKATTRTHTTDSFLRKQFTKTHTTDANKRVTGLTRTHTTDANRKKATTVVHTTSANKRLATTKTHTTDSNKRVTGLTRTHTTDSFLRRQITKTHTTDANRKKATTRTHTTDALRRTLNTKVHTTDSLLRKQFTKTHTTDAFKRTANTRTHATDSFLRRQITRTHTTDSNKRLATVVTHTTGSNLRKAQTRTHTADANKRKALTATHTTDANKRAATVRTHTTDTLLRKTNTRTHTTDSFLRKQSTRTHTTDTLIRKANTRTHTADSNKRKATLVTHTTDSIKRKTNTLAHSTDAYIDIAIQTFTLTHTTDSLLRRAVALTHTTSSFLRRQIALTHTTDSNRRKATLVSHTTDSNKRLATVKTHTTDANKRVTGITRTHTTDTLLRRTLTRTHTTDTLIRAANTRTHTTDSLKRKATLVSHTTDSNKKRAYTVSHTADANRRITGNTRLHTTDALKRTLNTRTHTTDALKRKATIVAHTADALLRKTNTRTHTADANKRVAGNLRTHTADANKRKTGLTRTHTTDAQIFDATDTSVYYFDASDSGPTGSATNPSQAFNSNNADAASNIGIPPAYLVGGGTTAPTSGNTITLVRVRTKGSSSQLFGLLAEVWTQGLGEQLGTAYASDFIFGSWTSLSVPSGGWTWQKVNDLVVRFAYDEKNVGSGSSASAYIAEVEVTYSTVASQTRTHTTDAFRRAQLTRTHTTDANRRKATTVSHVTDANRRVTGNVVSHTTDALRRKANTLAHTTDSFLRRQLTRTHTTDSIRRAITTLVHTTDALRRTQPTLVHTTDSNRRKATLVSHLTDANKRRAYTVVHTTDANKKKAAITVAHTTDTLLRRQLNSTHTTDALKRSLNTRTHSTDSNRRKATLASHTTDSNKRRVTTVSHTTDAFRRTANTLVHTTNALLRKTLTLVHTTDSLLRRGLTRTHTTDSNKRKATTAVHTTDANKRKTNVVSHTTDARTRTPQVVSHTTNSFLRQANTKVHSTDALKRKATTVSHTTDARLLRANSVDHSTDAHVTYDDYSREDLVALPTTDNTLATRYTGSERSDVATDDDTTYVPQAGFGYLVHEFKHKHSTTNATITPICNLKTTLATTSQPVYLQIFNQDSGLWETIDMENTVAANTDFTLTATVSTNLPDYYTAGNWVTCRVYQGVA